MRSPEEILVALRGKRPRQQIKTLRRLKLTPAERLALGQFAQRNYDRLVSFKHLQSDEISGIEEEPNHAAL